MPSPTTSTVVIIGARWTGLAASKTYLQLFPSISLTIIDADTTVGGVWSSSRIYPGLIADSCAAIFDYSDFPMDEVLGIDKWADLPAEKVHEYLEKYVDSFKLRGKLKLGTRVVGVEKAGNGAWTLEVEKVWKEFKEQATREVLGCDKLIVAIGTASTPSMSSGIDWEEFEGPVMHSGEVGMRHQVLTDDNIKKVIVVGGNKSAVDVVNLCTLAGKEVDWVFRREGYGPGTLFEARSHGIHAGAIKAIRASVWQKLIGMHLLKFTFSKLDESALSMYERNENTMKIAPDLKEIFWSNAGLSEVHDNSNFFDMVAEGKLIHVHRASIPSFGSKSVTLSDSQHLPCDAAVFAPSWKMNQTSIFDPSLLSDLGLPCRLSDQSPHEANRWNTLDTISEAHVRELFPMLANPPREIVEYDKKHAITSTLTPFLTFRCIAPPTLTASDRSLIVLGSLINTVVPIYAEASALWDVVYLENLPFAPYTTRMLEDVDEMEKDISLVNVSGALRFRDAAASYLDGSVEIQDFTDLLMHDLGLRADRKRFEAERTEGVGWFILKAWCEERFYPYFEKDYRGLVDEYRKRWELEKQQVQEPNMS